MQMSALFGTKNFVFFEIYDVSAQIRGERAVEPVRTFCGQGEGDQFLAILCGRLLWTALTQTRRYFCAYKFLFICSFVYLFIGIECRKAYVYFNLSYVFHNGAILQIIYLKFIVVRIL